MANDSREMELLELACTQGLISRAQLEAVSDEHTRLTREGRARSPTRIAIERGILSDEDTRDLETDVWIRGLPTEMDQYRISRLLGRGGMAVVFEARDVSLGKAVALKVLLPEFASSESYLARFHREARIAAKLTHPNTVQVFGAGEANGMQYLVMEYVEGETLADIVRSRGRIPEAEALDIVLGVTGALEEAAALGIVHRDIKPGNVLMSKWGVPKLADFGIAKEFGDIRDPRIQRSLTMGVVGTPMYMSPEQARGVRQLDLRADIYSLGATLYHLVVGDVPFYAETPQETMVRVVSESPRPPRTARPDLSEAAGAVICRMMAKHPDNRYPDYDELRADIEAARDGEPVSIGYEAALRRLLPTAEVEEVEDSDSEDGNVLRVAAVASAVAAAGVILLLLVRGCAAG